MSERRALVLGGGGITGIAWETGVVAGLLDAGIDLTTADTVIGTSAGSVVGAQLRSGTSVEDLYARQLEPPVHDVPAKAGAGVVLGLGRALLKGRRDPVAFRREAGAFALKRAADGKTPTTAERLAAIADRLPSQEWSAADLLIVVVDADTGEERVLDRSSGVPLLHAVAASCAVPGVYPPVDLDGHTYVDGGVRSGSNADLAAGHDRVLVLAPMARGGGPVPSPQSQLRGLDAESMLISPDPTSRRAIGRNVLDHAARPGSAAAGRAQGRAIASRVRAVWP